MQVALLQDVVVNDDSFQLPNFRRFHKFKFDRPINCQIINRQNYQFVNVSNVTEIDLSPLHLETITYGDLVLHYQPRGTLKITLTMSATLAPDA
jgi:hypothetical protein